jgi:cytochrome c
MYRSLIMLVGITISVAVAAGPSNCNNPASSIPLNGKSCGKLTSPQLSCYIPSDVEGALAQQDNNTIQRAADIFSWQQFIALNWPAAKDKRGEPAADQAINAPGPRVWETWKEAYEVYLKNGAKPGDWNTPQAFPAACSSAGKMLLRTSKVSDVVDQELQALPADGTLPASLKDQKGRLVRYEIRLNKTVFDYVVKRRLYDGKQQVNASSIDFPVGSQLVKAAWREIDGDEAKYFLATEACVCDAKDENCQVKRMGLAGFHLMTKTVAAPQWIWSTYEQTDNVTAIHKAVTPLNNPSCSASQCPPNKQTPDGVPTQLTRVIPIPAQDPDCNLPNSAVDNIVQLNGDVQKSLAKAGSPLSNYDLINTQWPVQGTQMINTTDFQVRPALLGNSTMESFSQDTSTCMGCHVMSRTLNPDHYVSGDFSFTLNNAEPHPKGATCVGVEASESCNNKLLNPPPKLSPNSEIWIDPKVQHGYNVATKTYEVVGSDNVGNKLHCQSCHLNAGGNPDASWWAGVQQRQGGLEGLQKRINSCFENSMDGKALCKPGKDCDSNKHMSGLIAYMNWLTEKYKRKHPGETPTSGFPYQNDPRFTAGGNAAQGGETYTQKCAFCHNKDGEGRYEHGYFRPALWGADSYKDSAGMGSIPSLLPAFLYSNMPYTSGGMLTVDEARDLAAYINSQCRPGKSIGPNGKFCSSK